MYKDDQFDVRRHIHPKDALREIYEVMDKVGAHAILNSPKYKREKEKFIGAAFCFAIRIIEKREVFLQQPKDDPPDFKLLMPTDRATKERPFDTTNVELVTAPPLLDSLAPPQIIEETRNIVSAKLLPTIQVLPSTTLLIFLNVSHQQAAYWGVTQAVNACKNVQYMSIWTIFITSVDAANPEMTFAANQLYPALSQQVKFGLGEEAKKGVVYPHSLLQKYEHP